MIRIENLSHQYRNRNSEAIKNIDLKIKKGEIVVLLGSSGSGKSTLLRCMNRIIDPLSGRIFIEKENILSASPKRVKEIRQKIGMIFQSFNLIDGYTVIQNVLTGRLSYTNTSNSLLNRYSEEDIKICKEILKRVGLDKLKYEKVLNLSGGEKQRVGIARALAQQPKIILADEPVSNLDPTLMKEIMDLLQQICKEDKITLIVSLHFLELAKKYATRIIGMKNGEIVFNDKKKKLKKKNIAKIYEKNGDWFYLKNMEKIRKN